MAPALEVEFLQRVHAAEPADPLYLPFSHPVHDPPSDPVYPMLQRHFEVDTLPGGEWECAVHCKQAPGPVKFLYWPASQEVQLLVPVTTL